MNDVKKDLKNRSVELDNLIRELNGFTERQWEEAEKEVEKTETDLEYAFQAAQLTLLVESHDGAQRTQFKALWSKVENSEWSDRPSGGFAALAVILSPFFSGPGLTGEHNYTTLMKPIEAARKVQN